MLTLKEKMELVLSSLSSVGIAEDEKEVLKKNYDDIREKTLDEDLFLNENFSDAYFTMRRLDLATSDYIKVLEDEISELRKLVVGFGVGTIQDNAESMKKIINK